MKIYLSGISLLHHFLTSTKDDARFLTRRVQKLFSRDWNITFYLVSADFSLKSHIKPFSGLIAISTSCYKLTGVNATSSPFLPPSLLKRMQNFICLHRSRLKIINHNSSDRWWLALWVPWEIGSYNGPISNSPPTHYTCAKCH